MSDTRSARLRVLGGVSAKGCLSASAAERGRIWTVLGWLLNVGAMKASHRQLLIDVVLMRNALWDAFIASRSRIRLPGAGAPPRARRGPWG